MHKTIIIAEAGVNHNGSLARALEMVQAAAGAGADFVKFQTFDARSLVCASAPQAAYQQANAPSADSSQLAMLRGLQLSQDDFARLARACADAGIGFMSTPFDLEAVDVLDEIGQRCWKIPSGEITNLPLLRKIGRLGQEVILSTGMCTLDEVEAAVSSLEQAGTPRSLITLLHCTTQYPTPPDQANLAAMYALGTLGCRAVGYSDHTAGLEVPLVAVAMGAAVIEKHFTLDRSLPGPDHKASLEPAELAEMVSRIRRTELIMGDGIKRPAEAELPNIAVARKSIVARVPIAAGEVFTSENLTAKRPGTGLSPMLWDDVVGRRAWRDFAADEPVTLDPA